MCQQEKTESLFDVMFKHLCELASDRKSFRFRAQVAESAFEEKLKTMIRYVPDLAKYFTPDVEVGTDTIDCEYEIIG